MIESSELPHASVLALERFRQVQNRFEEEYHNSGSTYVTPRIRECVISACTRVRMHSSVLALADV
jgi:hypothetical protein